MPIVITREKGVPRRLYGFREDAPRPKPRASDLVHPDVEAVVEEPDAVVYPEESEIDVSKATDPYVAVAPSEASDPVVDSTETVKRTVSMGTMLTLPFFAYLTFTTRLPLWARLVSGVIGAGLLVGEGGLLQTWSARDSGEEPLFQGYGRGRKLRGYHTPWGEVSFSSERGLGDCGCGCGGKPGGCGG